MFIFTQNSPGRASQVKMLSRELQGTAARGTPEELHYPFCEATLPQICFSVNITTNWEFYTALDYVPMGLFPVYCVSPGSQVEIEGLRVILHGCL